MSYVKYKTINANCTIQTLTQYQNALDSRFGRNKIKALDYKGMKLEVEHSLLEFNSSIGLSTPHRLLHWIKYPETILGEKILGFKPSVEYRKKDKAQYQKDLNSKYGKDILKVLEYIDYRSKATHLVKRTGNIFTEIPSKLLWSYSNGNTFKNGGRQFFSKDPEEFHQKIAQISKNKVICLTDYKGSTKSYKLKCLECSTTWGLKRTPLYKQTLVCPKCNNLSRFSKKGLDFIKLLQRRYKLSIRSATSPKGEKVLSIPGFPLLRVDGFSYKYNIVFEFYGNVFHGNLKVLKPNLRNHPYNDKTNKELYTKTITREKALRKAGFSVVSIWENEFDDSILFNKFLTRTDKLMRKILWDRNLD